MSIPNTSEGLMDALRLGGIVTNPTQIKQWQLLANILAAILMILVSIITAILSVFDITIPFISETVIIVVSGGLAALWLLINNFVAIISSKKIGVSNVTGD